MTDQSKMIGNIHISKIKSSNVHEMRLNTQWKLRDQSLIRFLRLPINTSKNTTNNKKKIRHRTIVVRSKKYKHQNKIWKIFIDII